MKPYTRLYPLLACAVALPCLAQTPTAPTEPWLNALNRQAVTPVIREARKPVLGDAYARSEVGAPVASYIDHDVVLLDSPEITAYLDSIAKRLLTNWKGAQPQYRILLRSSDEVCGAADLNHSIVVCTGFLRAAQSEDQVAALLAHELAHLLLDHVAGAETRRIVPLGFGFAGNVAASLKQQQAAPSSRKLTPKAQQALETSAITQTLWTDMIGPSFNRTQERDADRLGLDLMKAAGYNDAGYRTMLEQHDEVRIARSDRMEAFRQVALSEADAQPATTKQKPAQTNKLIDLTALTTQLRQSATTSLVDMIFGKVGDFAQNYDSPTERWTLLEQYLATAYPKRRDKTSVVSAFDATVRGNPVATLLAEDQKAHQIKDALARNDRRGALTLADQAGTKTDSSLSLRFAQAQAYSTMNRFDRAVPLLESVTQTTLAPSSAYRQLAEGYARTNKPAQATASLELGMRRIGRENGFLPDLVEASRRGRQSEQAENFAMECNSVQQREILSNPFAALAVAGDQSGKPARTLYDECVQRLGYDPVKRREQQNKRDAKSTKFPDLSKILKTAKD